MARQVTGIETEVLNFFFVIGKDNMWVSTFASAVLIVCAKWIMF